MKLTLRGLHCGVFVSTALHAHACTVCQSATGHQVRAGLFNGHFLHTLLLVLAPFPVFAALVGVLAAGFPQIRLDSEKRSEGSAPVRCSESLGAAL